MTLTRTSFLTIYLIHFSLAMEFSEISNFFHNYTLQFIADFTQMDKFSETFFHKVITNNKYSPTVLDRLSSWNFSSSRYNNLYLENLNQTFKTVFTEFRPKFSPTVSLFILTLTFDPYLSLGHEESQTTSSIQNLLEGIVASNENPEFIFLQLNQNYVTSPFNLINENITLTSKFLVFGNNFPLHMLCFPCKSLKPVIINNQIDIKNAWLNLNSDLQNSLIRSKKTNRPYTKSEKSCSANFMYFNSSIFDCPGYIIAKKHNYSESLADALYNLKINKEISFLNLQSPSSGSLQTNSFNEEIFTRSVEKHSIIVHGIIVIPFQFITVSKLTTLNFETLLMPLDSWTWMGIVLSVLLIVLIFVLLTTNTYKYSITINFGDKLFWTVSVILEQNEGDATFRKVNEYKVMLLLAVWYFATFLLGIAYTGELFSCLTSVVPISVPKTLAGILNKNLPILTTSEVKRIISGEIFGDSMLKRGLIPDQKEAYSTSHRFYEFLTKLEDNTHFISENMFVASQNISKQEPISIFNNSDKIITPPYVLMDPKSILDSFSETLALFVRPSPVFIRNHEHSNFISRIPWHGDRNFLYPFFAKALGHLVQSGIYDKWWFLVNANDRLEKAKNYFDKNNTQYYNILFAKEMSSYALNAFKADPLPVSFEAMKYAFTFCAILLLLSIIVFLLETFTTWKTYTTQIIL